MSSCSGTQYIFSISSSFNKYISMKFCSFLLLHERHYALIKTTSKMFYIFVVTVYEFSVFIFSHSCFKSFLELLQSP